MVRAVLTMLVREGCENNFEEIWRSAVEDITLPGSLGQTMMRDPKEHRRYVITGDWESQDALKAFEQSPRRLAMSAAFEPLRESASKTVLEIVARA